MIQFETNFRSSSCEAPVSCRRLVADRWAVWVDSLPFFFLPADPCSLVSCEPDFSLSRAGVSPVKAKHRKRLWRKKFAIFWSSSQFNYNPYNLCQVEKTRKLLHPRVWRNPATAQTNPQMNRFSPFSHHSRWKSQTMRNIWPPTCNFMFKVMSCRLTISSEANSFSGFSSTIQSKRERLSHFYARLLYSLHVQKGV